MSQSLLNLIFWICTDKENNYYYIDESKINYRNAIVRNLYELVDNIKSNQVNEQIYKKLQRMFILDKDFDYGIIYVIKNSIKNFI